MTHTAGLLELTDLTKTFTLHYSQDAVLISNDVINGYMHALEDLHASIPLTDFECKRTSGQADPKIYSYIFHAVDGREWRQNLKFIGGEFPDFSWRIPDYWNDFDLTPHRAVRLITIDLIRLFGATEITVEWFHG